LMKDDDDDTLDHSMEEAKKMAEDAKLRLDEVAQISAEEPNMGTEGGEDDRRMRADEPELQDLSDVVNQSDEWQSFTASKIPDSLETANETDENKGVGEGQSKNAVSPVVDSGPQDEESRKAHTATEKDEKETSADTPSKRVTVVDPKDNQGIDDSSDDSDKDTKDSQPKSAIDPSETGGNVNEVGPIDTSDHSDESNESNTKSPFSTTTHRTIDTTGGDSDSSGCLNSLGDLPSLEENQDTGRGTQTPRTPSPRSRARRQELTPLTVPLSQNASADVAKITEPPPQDQETPTCGCNCIIS